MPIVYQKFIYRDDLKKNPHISYVFGDNDERTGYGGQAREMRGEPNAIGIRTKRLASHDFAAYYSDASYLDNVMKISSDFLAVLAKLSEGQIVVFPSDGIGTGLAKLELHAPETLQYINNTIKVLEKMYGVLA